MMLHKAGWAIAILFLGAQFALAQPDPGEKLPLPKKTPLTIDGPALELPGMEAIGAGRPPYWFYANVESLVWWVNHGPAPVLLTTAPNNGLNDNGLTGGILGEPGTLALFTGNDIDYGAFAGMRGTVGTSLDVDGFWVLELSGFFLPTRGVRYGNAGTPNGTPLLVIPFQDAATGQQSGLDVSAQDFNFQPYLSGGIAMQSDLRVWGYEVDFVAHSIRTAERSIDLLFGFRSLALDESLGIHQVVTPAQDGNITLQYPAVGGGAPNYFLAVANTPVFVTDAFSVRNRFYGAQVGARYRWDFGRLSADLAAKVAVGVTNQSVNINGSSTAALAIDTNTGQPSPNLTTPGGMFALANNIGNHSQSQFTVVPEINFNLKFAVASWLHLHCGYSALYWSNVARPGSQIDTVLNSKLIPTGALLPTTSTPIGAFIPGQEQGRPYFAFRDTAFWAHGLNFGVELRY